MKKRVKICCLLVVLSLAIIMLMGCTFRELLDGIGLGQSADGEGRDARIEGAKMKANEAQEVYAQNLAYTGTSTQVPEGTVFLVHVNGYYIEYKYVDSNLDSTGNPETLPETNPYENNTAYKQVTDAALTENIKDGTFIYEPVG